MPTHQHQHAHRTHLQHTHRTHAQHTHSKTKEAAQQRKLRNKQKSRWMLVVNLRRSLLLVFLPPVLLSCPALAPYPLMGFTRRH